jgi:hypothetical protein
MNIDKKPVVAAIGVMLLLGATAMPASARWGDNDERRYERHYWTGNHYRSPPIVYDGYYRNRYGYYPPPVVYGPGPGFYYPGPNIIIR